MQNLRWRHREAAAIDRGLGVGFTTVGLFPLGLLDLKCMLLNDYYSLFALVFVNRGLEEGGGGGGGMLSWSSLLSFTMYWSTLPKLRVGSPITGGRDGFRPALVLQRCDALFQVSSY